MRLCLLVIQKIIFSLKSFARFLSGWGGGGAVGKGLFFLEVFEVYYTLVG